MVTVSASPRFKRAYGKLHSETRELTDKALRLFIENPRHGPLHFEKLSGSDYRTIRVNSLVRIVLRGDGGDFELVDVDVHKKVDQKYG